MSYVPHELLSFILKEGGSCHCLRKPGRTESRCAFCEFSTSGACPTFGKKKKAQVLGLFVPLTFTV